MPPSSRAHVVDVAGAIPGLMSSYADGDRPKREIQSLFLYLRMARDIHFWCRQWKKCPGAVWETAGAYSLEAGSTAGEAMRGAFDAFVAHPLFMSRDVEHGAALDSVATAMAEFPLHELYLHVITRWLQAWDDGYASSKIFRDAMERILDIAYWGHRRPERFGPRFGGDEALFEAFRDFALEPAWLESRSRRIMERVVLEVGRFSKYQGTANYDRLPSTAESDPEALRGRRAREGGLASPGRRDSRRRLPELRSLRLVRLVRRRRLPDPVPAGAVLGAPLLHGQLLRRRYRDDARAGPRCRRTRRGLPAAERSQPHVRVDVRDAVQAGAGRHERASRLLRVHRRRLLRGPGVAGRLRRFLQRYLLRGRAGLSGLARRADREGERRPADRPGTGDLELRARIRAPPRRPLQPAWGLHRQTGAPGLGSRGSPSTSRTR